MELLNLSYSNQVVLEEVDYFLLVKEACFQHDSFLYLIAVLLFVCSFIILFSGYLGLVLKKDALVKLQDIAVRVLAGLGLILGAYLLLLY